MAYRQQHPQQYPQPGYPQRPRRRHNPLVIGCAALFGVFVALIVVVAVIGAATKSNKNAASVRPPTVDVTTTTSPVAKPAATKPAQPAKPVTVLTERGNGIKSTRSFEVHGDWDLAYAFDCSSFGGQGNFAVTVNGSAGDVLVNELAAKGSDITHQHDGPGKISLEVNSECTWTIRVDQLP